MPRPRSGYVRLICWLHLALLEVLALNVHHALVVSLQERLVQPLPRAHQPFHLEFLHTTVGPNAQPFSCRARLGEHELLQLRVVSESLPSRHLDHELKFYFAEGWMSGWGCLR